MITSQQPIVVAMYDNLKYDLTKDFALITRSRCRARGLIDVR